RFGVADHYGDVGVATTGDGQPHVLWPRREGPKDPSVPAVICAHKASRVYVAPVVETVVRRVRLASYVRIAVPAAAVRFDLVEDATGERGRTEDHYGHGPPSMTGDRRARSVGIRVGFHRVSPLSREAQY